MQEILDYIFNNWELTILPALVFLCGITGVIVKRTSTKKDDEVLEKVESAIEDIDKVIKDTKEKIDKKNNDSADK